MFATLNKSFYILALLIVMSCNGSDNSSPSLCSDSFEKLKQGLCQDHLHWEFQVSELALTEEQPMSELAIRAIDPKGGLISYRIGEGSTCGHNWDPALAIDETSGVLSGTPRDDIQTECEILISASSDDQTISTAIKTQIQLIDDPLTWKFKIANHRVLEDTPLHLIAQASDSDSIYRISYSINSNQTTCGHGFNPPLSINSNTGVISGTPENDAVGSCIIAIEAINYFPGRVSHPNLAIPDNDTNYIVDTIHVDDDYGLVTENFSLDIELTHTFLADLELILVAPNGREVVLHSRGGGDSDDIIGNYPNSLTPIGDWASLIGSPIKGDWQLRIRDQGVSDLGTLVKWGIKDDTRGTALLYQSFELQIDNVNDEPQWTLPLTQIKVDELNPLEDSNLAMIAMDIDANDTLSYNIASDTCQGWQPQITIDAYTGKLSGTPPIGSHSCQISIQASDGIASISHNIHIDVVDIDLPPIWINKIADFTIAEHMPIQGKKAAAIDLDTVDSVSYALEKISCSQDWSQDLTISEATGFLSGTPGDKAVGDCVVRIIAKTGGLSSEQILTIKVLNVPDLPTWVKKVDQLDVGYKDQLRVGFQISDVDPSDSQSYRLDFSQGDCDQSGFNPRLRINPQTGVISGRWIDVSLHKCSFAVLATSGEDTLQTKITLNLKQDTIIPEWALLPQVNLVEEQAMTGIYVTAVDPLGGEIRYGILANNCGYWQPALTIDPVSGLLSGTPQDESKTHCNVMVSASSRGKNAMTSLAINIELVNDPMVWLAQINDQLVQEKVPLNGMVAQAIDADSQSAIRYTIASEDTTCGQGFDPELSIDPLSGIISGTPGNDAVGDCSIHVLAQVHSEAKASSKPNLEIPDAGDFVTDRITIADANALVSKDFSVDIEVKHRYPSNLKIILQSPEGTEITLHEFTTPRPDDIVGTYPKTLTPADDLSDLIGSRLAGTWTLKLKDFYGIGQGTLVSWSINDKFQAEDQIEQRFNLTVNNVDDPLVWLDNVGTFSSDEGQELTLSVRAEDIDATTPIVYGLDHNCSGKWQEDLSIDIATGTVTGQPSYNNFEVCDLFVSASTGEETITQKIQLTINDIEMAPYWVKFIDDFNLKNGQAIRLKKAVAFDADLGQIPMYTLEKIHCPVDWDQDISINPINGVLSGIPNGLGFCELQIYAESGEHQISHLFTIRIF